LWDRKTDGGFPEAKILKQRLRNHIEPERNLGHSDTPANVKSEKQITNHPDDANQLDGSLSSAEVVQDKSKCEDCV